MIQNTMSLINQDVLVFVGKSHQLFEGVNLKQSQSFKDKLLLHEDLTDKNLRDKIKGSTRLFNQVKNLGYESVLWVFDENFSDLEQIQILKKLMIFNTPFDTYIDKKKDPIALFVYNVKADVLEEATLRYESVQYARTLVNEPANTLTPTALAESATSWAEKHGIESEVYDLEKIKSLKMDAFLSVAKGSAETPQFIVLRYMNNPNSDEIFGLVGKGVTYDSGGLAIKPAASMASMHSDMGGSAAVLGAIGLLASKKAAVNAVAVVAACENMISGTSFKNGDIIGSMSGKHIEIVNTDAEGRLTLADAIYYAHAKENVTHIVDVATLTGAAIVALGTQITAVVSNDEKAYASLENASKDTADKIWRMPVDDELEAANHSKVADLKNATVGGAGTTTAALFLKAFTEDTPWTHLDIAGTAFGKANQFNPEGATGVGVELLADMVIDYFK